MSNGETFPITDLTRVQRQPARASYDRALAYAILDEALVCSIGFIADGQAHVLPMSFARLDDRLVFHGAPTSRLMQCLAEGQRICVTVTLLDGLVLARSAMHHSLNYRSVVVFGTPVEITAPEQKLAALARLVEHVVPGRSKETRPPNPQELQATRVVALPLEEVSVKSRRGGPNDSASDFDLPYWAGVIPLALKASPPVPDPTRPPNVPVPESASGYERGVQPPRTEGP